WIGGLGPEMREVDVQLWAIEREIGDQPSGQERPPLHARVKARETAYGRLGIGLLGEHEIEERQRQPDRVKPELADADAVAREACIHLPLDGPPQRFVDQKG